MSLYKELTDQPLDVLIGYWFGEPLDGPEYADTFFEEVGYEIARRGEAGASFLAKQITLKDQPRSHCLIGGISMAELSFEVRKGLIRPFLASDTAEELAEAIHSFCYFRDREVRDLIEPNVAHEDVRVRLAALMYLGKVFPLESLDLLVRCLNDPAWNIRATAIDEIDELEDRELAASFMDRIWQFLEDPHRVVRGAANWYLETRIWWDEEISDIGAQIDAETNPFCIATLVHLAGDGTEPEVVLQHLSDTRVVVRLAAIDELVESGPILTALEQLPSLIDSLATDPDPRVRDLVPDLRERLEYEEWRASKK